MATRAGSSFASAAVVIHAPACVAAAAEMKFLLSKKVRSDGAARSSGAILTMRRECGAGRTMLAPVKAAISSSVRPRDCRKNSGSLILLKSGPRCPGRPISEPRAAAEPENLGAVTHLADAAHSRRTIFCQRISKVEPKWAERRIPEQADADGRADQPRTVETDLQCFTRHIPERWSLVTPQVTGIRESGELDPHILRQEI